MKNRIFFYLFSAIFFSSLMQFVSYVWRKGSILDEQLQNKYFIGAFLIFVFGGLVLLSLTGLKKEVRQIKGKRKQYWKNIVGFVFTINCIGLPVYLIVFLLNMYNR